MKHRRRREWMALFATAVLLFAAQIQSASAAVSAAHKAIQNYDGSSTCAMCHPSAAQEVVESLHYQMRGEAPFRVGWEAGTLGGMKDTY